MAISFSFSGSIDNDAGTFAGSVGIPLSAVVVLSGDVPPTSAVVSAGSLPGGVTLDAAPILYQNNPGDTAFLISGAPSAAGSFPFSLHFADSAAQTVTAPTHQDIAIVEAFEMNFPYGSKGQPFSFQFTGDYSDSLFDFVFGAHVPPYTYGPLLWAGPDPGGMTLTSGGLFSGTPVAALLTAPFDAMAFEASIAITDSTPNEVSADMAFLIFRSGAPGSETGAVYGTFTGFWKKGLTGGGTK